MTLILTVTIRPPHPHQHPHPHPQIHISLLPLPPNSPHPNLRPRECERERERGCMSGYYQLLPTRPDGDPPPSNVVRDPPSLLTRLVAALPFSFHPYDRYRSFPNFNRSNFRWNEPPKKRHTTLYVVGASAACVLVLALVVYQERMKEYIIDTFYGPAPPAACLRDPSAASSYVPWRRPLAFAADDDQLLYHCIKVPQPSEPPPLRAYQSLPSTCRDAFFESGEICNHPSTLTPSRFDLVWTWVNGSDPLLHDAMAAAEHSAGRHEKAVGLQEGQKLYRSVLLSFRSHGPSSPRPLGQYDPVHRIHSLSRYIP